jgi:Chalcone isomerase-like
VLLRDVSRETFVQAVETGILRNSSLSMPTLRGRLDLLEQTLPALEKGNVLDFTYLPGAGTLLCDQGQQMTIPGKDFADALFSAWLGTKPVNAALKRELLGAYRSLSCLVRTL